MIVVILLLIIFNHISLIWCYEEGDLNEEDPIFISAEATFNILENSTLYLPCYLQNMENTATIWYKNGQKVADTQNLTFESPKNIELQKNYSLEISNIRRTDSGEYSCHIYLFERNITKKLNHIVNVLFPPTVFPEPSSGALEVELGQSFMLSCDVIGNPIPKMKWFFEEREIPAKNRHSFVFNVSKARKDHAGEYECVANNSIGELAIANFQIRVLYYPEITVEKEWIHSAIGERAELSCNITANPRPKVDWFHDGKLVNFSSKFRPRVYGDKYILLIKNLKYDDFGNYTCQGTNFLGRNIKTIQISGLANPAVFKQDPIIRTETSYTLIWEVDSYSPIIHYNLRFRKEQRGDVSGQWVHLIIPAASSLSPIHSETYTLTGLEPASIYETTVTSKNEFGWSESSKVFRFATLGTDFDDVSRIDKEVNTSILSTEITDAKDRNEINEENDFWKTSRASLREFKVSCILLSIMYSCRFIFL